MTRILTFLIVLLNLTAISSKGQNLLPVKKSDYVDNIKERKSGYQKIKEAEEYYEKGLGFVDRSLLLLLEAYELNEENAELNFNIGICYLTVGPKMDALPYLLSAESLNPDVCEEIHFYLGMAYQYNLEFAKAITHYKMNVELIELNNYKEKAHLIPLSHRHIQECKNAKIAESKPLKVNIENLGGKVNSSFDDFNPLWMGDKLIFSSRRAGGKAYRSGEDQRYIERVYQTERAEGLYSQPQIEECDVTFKNNIAILTGKEKDKCIIYNSGVGNGDLFFAKRKNVKWKIDKACKFINEPKSRESSASYSEGGNKLYFISDRNGGFGESDIYYCEKNSKGEWGKPVNIGGDINTEFDEGDVFVTEDGKEMYFSSKGHNSIGGYDIFKCVRDEKGVWSSPVNLGMPINSVDNDITFTKNMNDECFFASARDGGLGGFDMYVISELKEEKEEIVEVAEKKEEVPVAAKVKKEEEIEVPVVPVVVSTVGVEEIKLKQELVKDDFVYRVQIAACKNEMSPEDLFQRYKGADVIEHLFVEGWHKYTIGGFKTFEEAAKYRDSCGVSDAFVVLFKGGYRLGIARKTGGGK